MSWFKRTDANLDSDSEFGPESTFASVPADSGRDQEQPTVKTEGLWIKCAGCRTILFKAELEANLNVCPKCSYHFKIGARQRMDLLLEPGYMMVDSNLRSTDPLHFADIKTYKSRLSTAQRQT